MNVPGGRNPRAAQIASTLATIVDRYGAAALFKRDQIELLLKQESPDATKEIGLVLTALAEDVPQRLLAAHDDDALRSLLPRVVDGLARHPDFDQARASWAVRTWATALALPLDGLPAGSTAGSPIAASAKVPSGLTSVVTPLAGARRPEPARPAPPPPPPPANPAVNPTANSAATAEPQRASKPRTGPGLVETPMTSRPDPVAATPPIAAPKMATVAAARPDAAPSRKNRSFAIPLVAGATLVAVAVAVGYGWYETRRATDQLRTVAASAPVPIQQPAAPQPLAIPSPTDAGKPLPSPDTAASPPPAATAPVAATNAPEPTAAQAPPPKPAPSAIIATAPVPPTPGRIELPRAAKGKPTEKTVVLADRPDPASGPSAPSCTRASCGSVVSVRALESAGVVELIVRMDDREIQTVRQTGRWVVGTRVRKNGDRYVPLSP